jgi:Protein of unknown function (DUF2804)
VGSAGRMPLFRGARPLKRWRYVAVFCEQLMACAARVQIGPARQSFWAVHLRAPSNERGLHARTRTLRRLGAVTLEAGRVLVHDSGVSLELRLQEEAGVEARCLHGGKEVRTRKQAGVRACGTLALAGRPALELDALAVIDDTAGYHARRTAWHWSAGVGRGPQGGALAWNLVSGVNDPPAGSERAVWIAGQPHECGPVAFSEDLREIRAGDGSLLRFSAEAERSRRENLIVVSSDYRAPFGTFSGSLPGGIPLAHGLGVVERHRARW